MISPKRGEIWLVDFTPARGSEQAEQRPAVIIQNDAGNRVADTAISTNLRSNPTNVLIKAGKKSGLRQDSMAKTSQLLTVSKERLFTRLGEVGKPTITRLNRALKVSLALN